MAVNLYAAAAYAAEGEADGREALAAVYRRLDLGWQVHGLHRLGLVGAAGLG
jgi:hypothetical protein